MLKVAKFGGSSVAGPEQFKKVKAIVDADPSRRVVVVSAAGKRSSDDHKLTDLLYLCHAHLTYGVSCDDILDTILSRFIEIRDTLGLSYDIETEFSSLRAHLSKNFSVDELVSRGEYFTAKLMSDYLGYHFLDASDSIFFSFDGQPDREKIDTVVSDALEKYGKILVPGFYGALPSGKIHVMTRGGSDITGSLLAAAVNADIYENWTDVSGILMADPRIVSNPKPIPEITYSELRELAFMGASVLHEDSILPVKEAGITLNIRNTNRPDDPGTFIVDNTSDSGDSESADRFITGIAGRKNFDILTVTKRNMDICSTLVQTVSVFERYKISIEHITLGLDSFALVAASSALGDYLYDIIADIKKSCRPDDVCIQDNIALVSAVGRKMSSRPGVSGRLFKALGDSNINIRTIAQGADELAITVGVENEQFENAIRVLYDGFTL